MNASVDSSIPQDPLLERLNDYCQSNDMMKSERRYRVGFKLREMNREVDAEEVWISMKSEGYEISIACVYQSLNVLNQAGICISTKVKNRQYVYRIHPDYTLTSLGGRP